MNNIELKLLEINDCIIGYVDETANVNTLPSLYSGDMGIALFLSHYAKLKKDERSNLYLDTILNKCFDRNQ